MQPELLASPCPVVQAQAVPTMEEIRVEMADMKVSRRPVEFITSVGSCVAICMHDSISKCGGLAHIMLPNSSMTIHDSLPYKYADTAVPALAEVLRKFGEGKIQLSAKITGGANMFRNLDNSLNIGARNVEAVKEALTVNGIRLLAEDVGGAHGRRVAFNVVTGIVLIQSLSGETKRL